MKKIVYVILVVMSIILVLSFGMAGCTKIDDIEQIVGTYELQTYKKRYYGELGRREENLIYSKNVKMYLVLTKPSGERNKEDNTYTAQGYIYYQDKDTKSTLKKVTLIYQCKFDDDRFDKDEIESVSYHVRGGQLGDYDLKSGWRDLFIEDEPSQLYTGGFRYTGNDTEDIVYLKRVDRSTTTKYIESKVGSIQITE